MPTTARRVADQVLASLAAALVCALLLAVSAGVVSRALNDPLAWTDEASGYLMVWTACLGWMLATRRAAHIRIRFFLDRLPAALRRAAEAAIQLGLALFGAAVAWHALRLVHTNADIEAVALPLSAAWLYVPLVPAGLLTLAQALADLRALVSPAAAAASQDGGGAG